jgi:hypothetical protein
MMSEPTPSVSGHAALPKVCEIAPVAGFAGSSAEIEILLDSTRVHFDEDDARRVRAHIRGQPDWDCVLRMARRNRVRSLLYRNLKSLGPGLVPEKVLDELQSAFRDNALRNLRLTGELVKLLDLFAKQGIAAVPYKGPTLAALAYEDIALREFADLDLLLCEGDLTRARDLLLDAGFRLGASLTCATEPNHVKAVQELPLVSADGVLVELHLGFSPRDYGFALDPDRFRQRLVCVPVAGRLVPTFAVEDLLLILCSHGERHWWGTLGWICDVAELVRAQRELRWEAVLGEARRLHGERLVLLGLALAGALLRAPVPEVIDRQIRLDPTITWLVARVRKWLFRDDDDMPRAGGRALFHMRARERWRDGARYCLSRFWAHAFASKRP